ncbi:CAMK family kinase [Pyrrhoderma noxium]|uniref:mitogen-activated protein kinase kinase n=1 Tax=Pyrrhoderma noxium TaxID=2282107 RepID=A0A286UPU3_9AGAM|nr:CAMK family kinase [Pyrrhoderma noxium]
MDQRTRNARVQNNNRPRNPIKERPTRRDLLGHARGAVERVKEKLDIGTRKVSRNPTRATTTTNNRQTYSTETPPPPRPRHKYVWCESIGSGSFGVVYKMMKVDVETNSKAVYAVKTMEEGKQDATFSQKERQFLALIMANRHQNIVGYFGTFRSQNKTVFNGIPHICFSFEFVGAGDLLDRMASANHKLPEGTIAFIIRQILYGLNHLERLRIVHRDLKPANVLLTKNDVAKITDFGLCVRLPKGQREVSEPWAGSLPYIAPEGWLDKATHQFDIFSLGVILFELSNRGVRPFDSSPQKVMKELIEKGEHNHLFQDPEKNINQIDALAKQKLRIDIANKVIRNAPNWARFLKDRYYSSELQTFCNTLLEKDYLKRPLARRALREPWVKKWAAQRKPSGPSGPSTNNH